MISEIEIEPYPELDREFAGIEASRKEHRHAIAVGSFCQRPDSRGHQRLSVLRNQLHTMATKSAASPETNRRRSITSRVIHSPRGDGICSRKAIVTRPIGLR